MANMESRPSVGLGTDIRFESEDLTGFALALDNQVLHLSIFSHKNSGNRPGHISRIQRFSHRRRFRS
ncbi:MAG: hypothetical protein JRI36_06000 [Deltaproteobacteria bacterium]|nr:hypothetical protein [Deltaproteobacteria bacterium]